MLLMMLKQFPPVKRTTQSPDENTFDSLWSCPLSLSIRVFIKSVTSITNPQPPSIHLVIKKTILIVEGKFIIHGFHGWKVFCFPCFPHIFCTIPQWLWPMYILFFPQERLFLPTDLHLHCHEQKHANIGSQTKTTLWINWPKLFIKMRSDMNVTSFIVVITVAESLHVSE